MVESVPKPKLIVASCGRMVYDVRLHNTSQLAGFAKADDLAYFLEKIGGIKYQHQPLLAPTDLMLKAFKRDKGDWNEYKNKFLGLMAERKIEDRFKPPATRRQCRPHEPGAAGVETSRQPGGVGASDDETPPHCDHRGVGADDSPGNPVGGTKRDHGDGIDDERQDRHPAEPNRQGDERAVGDATRFTAAVNSHRRVQIRRPASPPRYQRRQFLDLDVEAHPAPSRARLDRNGEQLGRAGRRQSGIRPRQNGRLIRLSHCWLRVR